MNRQQNNTAKPQGPVVNWPLIICLSAALPIELLLHDVRTFGVRYVGPRAVAAVLVMFFFAGFHPEENCLPLTCLMIATILLGVIAQIIANVRRWRGALVHSRYPGRPILMKLIPWSEKTIKRLEPLLAFGVGWIVHVFNRPLGSLLVTAAICLAIKVGIDRVGSSERALDINDAMIEQTMALESVRNLRGR
jgi:hypothetical protein